MYTKQTRTRVFIRKNTDDALWQLFQAKNRRIQELDKQLYDWQMKADNLYIELHQIPHGYLYTRQQQLPLLELL